MIQATPDSQWFQPHTFIELGAVVIAWVQLGISKRMDRRDEFKRHEANIERLARIEENLKLLMQGRELLKVRRE